MSFSTGVSTEWFLDLGGMLTIGLSTLLGNMSIIGQSTWTLGLEVMLNTWITFIVQSGRLPILLRIWPLKRHLTPVFFTYRINILSKYHRWTLIPIYLLAFVQLGFGSGIGIKSMLPQTVADLACE